jgi:hypothetical protein
MTTHNPHNYYNNNTDFLPFKCDHCQRPFCVSHMKPADHGCAQAPDLTLLNKAPQCPVCERFVKAPVSCGCISVVSPTVACSLHAANVARVAPPPRRK